MEHRPKKKLNLPVWLVTCLVKAWFAGAVFFFVGWGLPVQSSDQLDLVLVLGLVLGVVMDLLVNRVLIYFETPQKNYRRFIFSYSPRFYSVPVNLIYGLFLSFCVAYTYHGINFFLFLGAEPILYGLFFMGYDMLFVFCKQCLKGLFRR